MNKYRKLIISSILMFVILIIIVIVYQIIPKSYLRFETAPQNVTVLIDNKNSRSIKNGDTIIIKPGKHTISVSKTGFGPYIKEITLNNQQTSDFLVALTPQTDDAKKQLDNSSSRDVIQKFYGKIYINQTDEMNKNYPILKVLPISARLYTISACPSKKYPDDQTKIALCVDSNQTGLEQYVFKDILSRGYNPDDYEFIWTVTP
jgi:hypothetical protein